MRPSFEALPSWLSRLPEVPPTPLRAGRPPEEGLLHRLLRNPRLPLHVALLAVGLGIGAAVAAGSVRSRYAAESHAEMSAFGARKLAELRAFGMLRTVKVRALTAGGSLTDDVPGFFDDVEGTDGRRFRRRWAIEAGPAGDRRIFVRVIPSTREAGRDSLDVSTVVTQR